MNIYNPLQKSNLRILNRTVALCVTLIFLLESLILPIPAAQAQIIPQILNLPTPGTMVGLSQTFQPAVIKGIRIFPDNPLKFDFIIDTGETQFTQNAFHEESKKLIKYFLASLTVPEDQMWVNLSPYEKDRIIPEQFGQTEMGRDLLAQDYLLKQITASLMYPEDEFGKSFWKRIRQKAKEQFGTDNIPVDTFHKVWILPQKATVYENGDSAFVVKSHLKVMLEEDYLALKNNSVGAYGHTPLQDDQKSSEITTTMIREILIPEIEREVNHGKNFAPLRQIYHSMILATWFKRNLRESILSKIYVGQNKIDGVDIEDKDIKEKIYQQYLKAFQNGVYHYIKEEYDSAAQEVIPRKYFSGGFAFGREIKDVYEEDGMAADVTFEHAVVVTADMYPQQRQTIDESMVVESQAFDESKSTRLDQYITYRKIFRATKGENGDVKDVLTDPTKFKAVVESSTKDLEPAKIDSLITRQAALEQSIIELVSNASDATTGRSSPIGRFGVGAMQMLAFVLDENNPILDQGAYVVVNTRSAQSKPRQILFFKGKDGHIRFAINGFLKEEEERLEKTTGTTVSINFPQKLKTELKAKFEQFLKEKVNLFTKMQVFMNGELLNPLDDHIYLNGDRVQYEYPDDSIQVKISDDQIIVEDSGSGMNDKVLLDKFLIPRLGENQEAIKAQSEAAIKNEVHLFYKGPQAPTEEATTRIVFQVSGINIQSAEVKGFGLPKELIIQLPASTKLTVSRDKIEIDQTTHSAIRAIAQKILDGRPIHQIALMNGFMEAVKILDEQNARVEALQPLVDTAKEIFIPFIMKQNKVILPNNDLFHQLDVPEDTLFLEGNLIYAISPEQIPHSKDISDAYRPGRLKKAFTVPFKKGAKVSYLEFGPYLLLNEKIFKKFKRFPLFINLRLNFYVGYGPKSPAKGWILTEKEQKKKREREKKRVEIAKLLKSYPTLKSLWGDEELAWMESNFRDINDPKLYKDEHEYLQDHKSKYGIKEIVVNLPEGMDLKDVANIEEHMTWDSLELKTSSGSMSLDQIFDLRDKIRKSMKEKYFTEAEIKSMFPRLEQFVKAIPESMRLGINWESFRNALDRFIREPELILDPDPTFLQVNSTYFLNQDHPDRFSRYLLALTHGGKLSHIKDQATIHKFLAQVTNLKYEDFHTIDDEVINYARHVFKNKNLENWEEAFKGINEGFPFVRGADSIKRLILRWLRIYKSDPKATEQFSELLLREYEREEEEEIEIEKDEPPPEIEEAIEPPASYAGVNYSINQMVDGLQWTEITVDGKQIAVSATSEEIQIHAYEPDSGTFETIKAVPRSGIIRSVCFTNEYDENGLPIFAYTIDMNLSVNFFTYDFKTNEDKDLDARSRYRLFVKEIPLAEGELRALAVQSTPLKWKGKSLFLVHIKTDWLQETKKEHFITILATLEKEDDGFYLEETFLNLSELTELDLYNSEISFHIESEKPIVVINDSSFVDGGAIRFHQLDLENKRLKKIGKEHVKNLSYMPINPEDEIIWPKLIHTENEETVFFINEFIVPKDMAPDIIFSVSSMNMNTGDFKEYRHTPYFNDDERIFDVKVLKKGEKSVVAMIIGDEEDPWTKRLQIMEIDLRNFDEVKIDTIKVYDDLVFGSDHILESIYFDEQTKTLAVWTDWKSTPSGDVADSDSTGPKYPPLFFLDFRKKQEGESKDPLKNDTITFDRKGIPRDFTNIAHSSNIMQNPQFTGLRKGDNEIFMVLENGKTIRFFRYDRKRKVVNGEFDTRGILGPMGKANYLGQTDDYVDGNKVFYAITLNEIVFFTINLETEFFKVIRQLDLAGMKNVHGRDHHVVIDPAGIKTNEGKSIFAVNYTGGEPFLIEVDYTTKHTNDPIEIDEIHTLFAKGTEVITQTLQYEDKTLFVDYYPREKRMKFKIYIQDEFPHFVSFGEIKSESENIEIVPTNDKDNFLVAVESEHQKIDFLRISLKGEKKYFESVALIDIPFRFKSGDLKVLENDEKVTIAFKTKKEFRRKNVGKSNYLRLLRFDLKSLEREFVGSWEFPEEHGIEPLQMSYDRKTKILLMNATLHGGENQYPLHFLDLSDAFPEVKDKSEEEKTDKVTFHPENIPSKPAQILKTPNSDVRHLTPTDF